MADPDDNVSEHSNTQSSQKVAEDAGDSTLNRMNGENLVIDTPGVTAPRIHNYKHSMDSEVFNEQQGLEEYEVGEQVTHSYSEKMGRQDNLAIFASSAEDSISTARGELVSRPVNCAHQRSVSGQKIPFWLEQMINGKIPFDDRQMINYCMQKSKRETFQDSESKILTPAKPDTFQDSESKILTLTKSETFQDSESMIPTPTKSESFQDRESRIPSPAKPDTFQDSESKILTLTKSETFQDSESMIPTPTKSESFQDRESRIPSPAKSETFQDRESKIPTPTKSETFQDRESRIPTPTRSEIFNNRDSRNPTPKIVCIDRTQGNHGCDSEKAYLANSIPRNPKTGDDVENEFSNSKSDNYAGFTQVPWPTAGTLAGNFRRSPEIPIGGLICGYPQQGGQTIPNHFYEYKRETWEDRIAVFSQLYQTTMNSYMSKPPMVIRDNDIEHPLHLHFAGQKKGFYYQANCMGERLRFHTVFQALTYMVVTYMNTTTRDLKWILDMCHGTMEEYVKLTHYWEEIILYYYISGHREHDEYEKVENLLKSGMLMHELATLINHKARTNDVTRYELKNSRNRDTFIIYEATNLPDRAMRTMRRPTLLDKYLFAGYLLDDRMILNRDFRYSEGKLENQCLNWAGVCVVDIRDRLFHEDYYTVEINKKVPEYPMRTRESMRETKNTSGPHPLSINLPTPGTGKSSQQSYFCPSLRNPFSKDPFSGPSPRRIPNNNSFVRLSIQSNQDNTRHTEIYQPLSQSQGQRDYYPGTQNYDPNFAIFQSNHSNPMYPDCYRLQAPPRYQNAFYQGPPNYYSNFSGFQTNRDPSRYVRDHSPLGQPRMQRTFYPRPQI